jgi:tripartite-type tricarboxylate transporter receptor subunit TctC
MRPARLRAAGALRRAVARALCGVLALCGLGAQAQDSTRPTVRIVVPYTTGGGIDVLARLLAQRLTELRGQSFVVENRPGAGATLGTAHVARSPADGNTFVVVSNTFALGAVSAQRPPYDVLRDFAPVMIATRAPFVLGVPTSLGANSLKDLVAVSKQKPGGLNFASSGTGTSSHLAIELLKFRTGLVAQHIPYKGSNAALIDLVAGRVDALFATPVAMMPLAAERKLSALAQTGRNRSESAPHIPTAEESGVADYEVVVYFALLAPAGTPRPLIDRFYADARSVLEQPEVVTRLRAQGQEVAAIGPDPFSAYLKQEIETWSELIAKTGMKLTD